MIIDPYRFSSVTTLPADYGTGAIAAFSLRYVSSNYSGDVIRVRNRDGTEQDFNPTEITDGTLVNFVNNISGGGFADGFVTKWYNQGTGGSTYDAVQSAAFYQPLIADNGIIVRLNSIPAVEFSIDELRFNAFSSNGFTIFCANEATTAESTFVSGGDNTSNRFDAGVRTTTDTRTLVTESGTTTRINTTTNYIGDYILYTGTKTDLRIDGSSVATGTISGDLQAYTSDNSIGTRRYESSDSNVQYGSKTIAELIIYNTDQTSNISDIEDNINGYYSIY